MITRNPRSCARRISRSRLAKLNCPGFGLSRFPVDPGLDGIEAVCLDLVEVTAPSRGARCIDPLEHWRARLSAAVPYRCRVKGVSSIGTGLSVSERRPHLADHNQSANHTPKTDFLHEGPPRNRAVLDSYTASRKCSYARLTLLTTSRRSYVVGVFAWPAWSTLRMYSLNTC